MLGAFTDCVRNHHRISASTKEAQAQAYFSARVEILREHNQRGTLQSGSPTDMSVFPSRSVNLVRFPTQLSSHLENLTRTET